jgi:glutamate-1-semialdehyde 2,1-aminomutase
MAQAKVRAAGGATGPRIPQPRSAAPSYAATLRDARALHGAWVSDAEGRERVDFVNARGAVLLGWTDREVEAAVRAERNPERLEIEAAERLRALVPTAEAVRFRPAFETALADALLAAKTATGRDGAFFFDEAASAGGDVTALRGALAPVQAELAAVVIRPLDAPGAYLAEARRLTRDCGALLIFDESRTAFRVHRGGAQALAKVAPDLTLIGAALANGRRLAAVAGPEALMRALPEADAPLSAAALAAACVTLARVDEVEPAQGLRVIGAEIAAEVETRLHDTGAAAWFELSGDPAWSLVSARVRRGADPAALEAALATALWEQGVLSFGVHVPSLETGVREVERLLRAYDAVLPDLVARARSGAFVRRAMRRAS